MPGSEMLTVSGQIALGSPAITETPPLPIRRSCTSTRCAKRWRATASSSSGRPLDIDDVRVAPDMSKATLLLEDRSPPLSEIIDVCLKWSRNEYAETLLRRSLPTARRAAAGRPAASTSTLNKWGISGELPRA